VNAVVGIIVIAALLCFVTSRVRSRQAGRYRRRVHSLAPRFLHRRERRAGIIQARELARAIIENRSDPIAHLAAGVVLQPGEKAWLRTPARLVVRTSQPAWIAHTQLSWLGRRSRNVTRQTTAERWHDYGKIAWLVTSQRVVGQMPASSEMFCVWWEGLAGVDIDLKRGRVVLNAVNGWTGMLSGRTLAPIAVAAVAMCYGLEALLTHPALETLRPQGTQQPPPPQEPMAVGSGGVLVRLPTRR
jgi:hypothetical protein